MLASVIREKIAPVLRECPRECGIVSITAVKVSPDLSFVDMTVSAFKEPEKALKYLKNEMKRLQKELTPLQLHRMPQIRFRLGADDGSVSRVEKILNELENENES